MSDSKESDKNVSTDSQAESKELPPTDSESESENDNNEEGGAMDVIRKFFTEKLKIGNESPVEIDKSKEDKVMRDLTFEGLKAHWRNCGFKNIITMVGAGISTSAGIPDFRTPGTGLYNNLMKYNLPYPTAIFDIDYFEENPAPFFALAKELYPGCFTPTPAHYFVRLLHEKGLLQRHYTQNIDTLDRLAGLPEDKIVEAHGSFYTNHCLGCKREYDMEWMKQQIFSDTVPKCQKCKSLVKPDIVFFGENLPEAFYSRPEGDFSNCDLLIIMGTSLEVHPFASLIEWAGPRCVRLLINRDAVGRSSFAPWTEGKAKPLLYGKSKNVRDVAFLGDCDAGVFELAEALGWEEELKELIEKGKPKEDIPGAGSKP